MVFNILVQGSREDAGAFVIAEQYVFVIFVAVFTGCRMLDSRGRLLYRLLISRQILVIIYGQLFTYGY